MLLAPVLNYDLVLLESVNLTSTSKIEEEDESEREFGDKTTSDLSELKYR